MLPKASEVKLRYWEVYKAFKCTLLKKTSLLQVTYVQLLATNVHISFHIILICVHFIQYYTNMCTFHPILYSYMCISFNIILIRVYFIQYNIHKLCYTQRLLIM